jgi:flagellar biogenesis protein FliO
MQSAVTYKTHTALAIVKRAGEKFAWRPLALFIYMVNANALVVFTTWPLRRFIKRRQILSVRRVAAV